VEEIILRRPCVNLFVKKLVWRNSFKKAWRQIKVRLVLAASSSSSSGFGGKYSHKDFGQSRVKEADWRQSTFLRTGGNLVYRRQTGGSLCKKAWCYLVYRRQIGGNLL